MPEPLVIPQPYPDSNPWEDISSIVTNGWVATGSYNYLMARVDENTVYLKGLLLVGDDPQMGVLPPRLRPSRGINEPGGWLRTLKATCEVDIWGNGPLILPVASLPAGTSLSSLKGTIYMFTVSYPRTNA